MPPPTGQHKQEEKGPERTWMESGSFARGALVRRGERTGTPASLPGRRIRTEETAPTMPYYAHRPPSPGRGLNTHGDKARAGRRGNTWGGVRGVRRRSSGGPSRQKMRPIRRVGGGGGTSTEQVRAKHCRPEPQGARQSPDKDRVKTWRLSY